MSLWTNFKADIELLERQKRERALAAVNRKPWKVIAWLRDRWLWLRWFSWQ